MGDRPALEAVLLDAGGTLVRLDFEWMAETLAALGAPADPAELRRAELEGRRRYDRSRGLGAAHDEPHAAPNGDIHAYFGGLLDGAGLTPPLRDLALERFFERDARVGLWRRPAEGARAALDRLRELGLRLAVVSNSDGRAEMLLADCGMLPGLEFVVDSHRVGVEKPDAGIFRIALDRMGVPPGRALYVGDIRSVDEVGARRAGVHFVLLDPYGDYAPPDTPRIARMDELATWIESHFELPARSQP